MSRIAKNDVNNALDRVAKNITDAAAGDGVTSRDDLKKALDGLKGSEKALTDIFFRFMDHRDFKTGARITPADVARAVAYAKVHLLAKYDVNNNGFSKSEIKKMSKTGQLAVALAAELKGVALPDTAPSSALGRAMTEAAKGADWMSESDSTPAYVESKLGRGQAVDGALILSKFASVLQKTLAFDNTPLDLSQYTAQPLANGGSLLAEQTVPSDASDQFSVDNAAAWAKIKGVFDANITDVKVFKVGPKDAQGALATDRGAYALFVLGKTADGKLAGVTFESVET